VIREDRNAGQEDGDGRSVRRAGRRNVEGRAPLFFVSVASKGLSHAVSLLFATLAGKSISVATKELTLHQNCARRKTKEARLCFWGS